MASASDGGYVSIRANMARARKEATRRDALFYGLHAAPKKLICQGSCPSHLIGKSEKDTCYMAAPVLEKTIFDKLFEHDGHKRNFGRGWTGSGGKNDLVRMVKMIEDIFTSTHNHDFVVTIPLMSDTMVSGRDNLQQTTARDLPSKIGDDFFDFLMKLRRSPDLKRAFTSLARCQYGLRVSFDTIKLYSRTKYTWEFPIEFTILCPEHDSELEILSIGPEHFWESDRVEPAKKRAREES